METEKAHVETLEYVQGNSVDPLPARVHWRKTVVVVLAINAMTYAQMIALVGSALLATQTTQYLGDNSKSAWLSTILTIFTLALNPILSQAADYWGRKWIIVITSLGGFAGPLVISRAQDIQTLLAGFGILGLALGCQSSFYTVVSEVVPRNYRAIAQATLNVSNGLGGISAILVGGALLADGNYGNFRIFWYIVASLYFLGLAGVMVGYQAPPRELESGLTNIEKLASLDLIGSLLLTAGLTTFCIALQWSGNPYSWTDAHVFAPFTVGIALLVSFSLYEWRFKKDRNIILHHTLFNNRNFLIALVTIFIEGLAFFTSNSYYAMEVQILTGTNLFQAGLRFSIVFFAAALFSFLVGFYTTWTKKLRETLVFGFGCWMIFNALMASITVDTSPNVFWGYPVICGIGLGSLLTNVAVVVQMSTPGDMISISTGIFIATRSLGATVGLAVNNAIFKDGLTSNIGPKVAAAVLPLGFPEKSLGQLITALVSGDSLAIAEVPGVNGAILGAAGEATKAAYVIGFRNVWICAAAFSAAGFIVVFFLRNVKSEFTDRVDAPVVLEK